MKRGNQNYHFINTMLRFVENDLTGCDAAMLLYLEKNPDDVYAMHVLGFTGLIWIRHRMDWQH